MFTLLLVILLLSAAFFVSAHFGHRETRDRLNKMLQVEHPSDENRQTYALLHSHLATACAQKKWSLMTIGAAAVGMATFVFGKSAPNITGSLSLSVVSFLVIITAYMVLSKLIPNTATTLPKPSDFGNDPSE